MDEWAALADLLERERDMLLAEWRQKVRELPSAQLLPAPTLNDHVPLLIEAVVDALRHPARYDPASPLANMASLEHGAQRAQNGYEIGEVVSEYSMLRSCVHTLAEIHGVPLRDGQVQLLNNMLDHSIGVAVKAFAQHCADVERKHRDEHLAFVAHDLRTPLNAVVLASRALEQDGQQPQERARMLDVLKRNVRQLAALVDSVLQHNSAALAEGREQPQRRYLQLWPLVQQLIAELQPTADFAQSPLSNQVPDDLMVFADADMLRRVLQNLLAGGLPQRPGLGKVIAAGALDSAAGGHWCEVRHDDASASSAAAAQTGRPSMAQPTSLLRATEPPQEGRAGLANLTVLLAAHGAAVATDESDSIDASRVFRFHLPPEQTSAGG